MKTCRTCGELKAFAAFHRDASKRDGYATQCAACKGAKARKKYREDDAYRERVKATTRRNVPRLGTPERQAWLEAAKEYKRERRRKYGVSTLADMAADRAANAAALKAERLSRQPHSAHVTAWKKARPAAVFVHRYRNDAEFNARQKIRARLRKLATKDSDIARLMAVNLKAGRFGKGWAQILGYTVAELVAHLRRTLPKGATWEQFLAGDLHIDHITPRAAFDLTDADEVRACWSLGNLRLLEADKNRAKAASIEVLL